MESIVKTVTSYVPKLAQRHLMALGGAPLEQAERQDFAAAVLLADVSGFTRLTETLAQRGPEGAEEMTRALNSYFGQLIGLATLHGGDIVKFAGDAMLILWPQIDTEVPLSELTARAAQCALAMQTQVGVVEAVPGAPLALHCAIGAGDMAYAWVGGVYGRWEFVVTGEALAAMADAAHLSSTGEVVLTSAAWRLVADEARGTVLEHDCVRIDALERAYELGGSDDVELGPEHEKALKVFLPGAVRSRLAAGQATWLAELRQVSVLFVNLPDLAHTTPIAQAQTLMQTLQACMYSFEGSINKLSVDEKGISMVGALGLPPLSHYDDPSRAVGAALAIHHKLAELGIRCSIGVTTGRVFCGEVGNSQRREYTMMGDVVNLAARLMQAAKGSIRCDDATYRDAERNYRFDANEPIALKGKQGLFVTYTPIGKAGYKTSSDVTLVGRTEERLAIAERMAALAERQEGSRILMEGEAGIGKSALISYALAQATACGVESLIGLGDEVEKNTPYQAWKHMFEGLFGFDDTCDVQTRQDRIAAHLADHPDDLRKMPLLSALWPLGIPENDLTASLEGQARANMTNSLLVGILARVAGSKLLMIVIDDAQWLDSASLKLLEHVHRALDNTLILIASRPLGDSMPTELAALCDAGAIHIVLPTMTTAEALELVAVRLGVTALPEPVSRIIEERAGGHPLFIENLGYALRDGGYLIVENETCRLAPNAGDLRQLQLPTTVQGIVMNRIDRLPPAEQLTLKIASVVGRSFGQGILADVHPIEVQREVVRQHLEDLVKQDLTVQESLPERSRGEKNEAGAGMQQAFKSAIIRDVAYNLMLFAQRKQLHQAVARWYEAAYADDLAAYYAFLAYHWSRAEVPDRAVYYLEKAGEAAERDYAYKEAAEFFEEALAFDKQLADQGDPRRRLRIEQWLGKVFKGMGRQDDARAHLTSALDLARSLDDGRAEGEALTSIAHLHSIRNENDLALEWFLKAEAKARQTGDGPQLMRCTMLLSRLRYRMGQVSEAVRISEDALETARQWPTPLDTSLHQAWLGTLHITSEVPGLSAGERMRKGIEYFEEAVPAQRALGNRVDLNNTLNLLGNAQWILGRYEEARATFEETLVITTELGVKYDEVCALINLAIQSHELGLFEQMSAQAQKAHVEASASRYPDYGLIALVLRSLAATYLGKVAEGVRLHEMAMSELSTMSQGLQEGLEMTILPYVAERQLLNGEIDAALATARRSWAQVEATGVKEYEQRLLTLLGELHLRRGDFAEARGRFEHALDLGLEVGAAGTLARARLGLAQLALAAGDRHQGKVLLDSAWQEAAGRGSRYVLTEMALLLGQLALEDGQEAEAVERLAEALRLGESSGCAALEGQARRWLMDSRGAPRY